MRQVILHAYFIKYGMTQTDISGGKQTTADIHPVNLEFKERKSETI